jgi:hypothetical protein
MKVAFGYPPIPLEVQSNVHCAALKREELVQGKMLKSLAMPTRQKYAARNLERSERIGPRSLFAD